MGDPTQVLLGRTALVTGAARRIGAGITRALHAAGMNLVIHYGRSGAEARQVAEELNKLREDSAIVAQADLCDIATLEPLVQLAEQRWDGLYCLVNNASSFYPTPVGNITENDWDELMGTNLRAPLFLSRYAAAGLREQGGVIINLGDVHAERPLHGHALYSVAKAGLHMLTKALAKELGPAIRVNAVAPGAILWPEAMDAQTKETILSRVVLHRTGSPGDVARAVLFLVRDAPYVTGQILAVDGGRTLYS